MSLIVSESTDGERGLNIDESKHILSGMNLLTTICHCLLGCIGFPINTFIAYAILKVEDLRSQTRYASFSVCSWPTFSLTYLYSTRWATTILLCHTAASECDFYVDYPTPFS